MKIKSGFVIQAPSGYLMTNTFSVRRSTAMKKALDKAEQKYNGLITKNFKKWKDAGYRVRRASIVLKD